MKRKLSIGYFLIVVALLGVVAATAYPFLYMLSVSVSEDIYVMRGEVTLFPKGFTTAMYELVLADSRIGTSYLNTILYVTVGTAVSLIVTAMGAYALSRKDMLFHKQLTLLVVFTMFFGGGMIPTFLVVKGVGIIDTLWGMILPTAVSTWNLIVMRTFFANIPK
ncbi:MAG TPA: hypothetical protein VEZ72_04160 [Paenibacillus sp.]|nr:hypothetical protein [Paenibacillus sp.]